MRRLVVAMVVVLATGCGGGHSEQVQVSTSTSASSHFAPFRKCTHPSRGFRACSRFFERKNEESAIYRRDGDGWTKLRDGLAGRLGWWRRVVGSHDRTLVLAQWSGECESPSAYVVASSDGSTRAIFRGHDSTVMGWTRDGRALVRLSGEIWNGNRKVYGPGVYRVEPRTLAVSLLRTRPARPGC